MTHCDQSQEARKSEAAKRNMRRQKHAASDLTSQNGPPDRQCHFETGGKKRKSSISKSENTKRPKIVTVIPETGDEDSDMDDFADTSTRKKVVFPSICVEGNVKEIVQYRAKFSSVSQKST